MKNNKSNARTIARTETHSAYEEGRWESVKEAQPTHKMWLSSRDGKVRSFAAGDEFNHAIDGEIVPIDELFSNGLMYPLEPNGEAGNVINCRCTFSVMNVEEE
jgi:uncharacterized protein with gpF-like domain